MADPVSIVAVSGSLHAPSKTTVLAHELLTAFADSLDGQVPVETHLIELSEIGRDFSGALTRAELRPVAEEALRRIESATHAPRSRLGVRLQLVSSTGILSRFDLHQHPTTEDRRFTALIAGRTLRVRPRRASRT